MNFFITKLLLCHLFNKNWEHLWKKHVYLRDFLYNLVTIFIQLWIRILCLLFILLIALIHWIIIWAKYCTSIFIKKSTINLIIKFMFLLYFKFRKCYSNEPIKAILLQNWPSQNNPSELHTDCRKTIGFYGFYRFNCISSPIKQPNRLRYRFTKIVV